MKGIEFLKVDLGMFDDGGASAPSSPSEGSNTGNAPQTNDSSSGEAPNIIYGKQEGDSSPSPDAQGKQQTGADTKPEDRTAQWAKVKDEYKDLFGAEVESIIKGRFKKYNNIEQQLGQVNPIISLLAAKYGEKDPAKLIQHLENEYYETEADKRGWTPEETRDFYKTKQENEVLRSTFHERQEQEIIDQTIKGWHGQAEELQKEYAGFDFDHWTQNEQFMGLLGAGIPVKQAYELCDMENIKAGIAKKAQQNVVQDIQARGKRITENGKNPTPGVILKNSVSDLTFADMAEIERRVARGEKIRF